MPADRVYWLHALTPLHVGAGRGQGYIDLPLARERVTNLPYVPGSSVKGVFADSHRATRDERVGKPLLEAAFGKADNNTADTGAANAGALVLTDARLVCLPVRSLYGTFAWCTSPFVLTRLARDLAAARLDAPPVPAVPPPTGDSPAPIHVPPGSALVDHGRAFLEDLDLTEAASCGKTTAWAAKLAGWLFPGDDTWAGLFQKRFAVVPDDLFNFLCETGTEVQPHVRIDPEFKRVATGALWYEESLPAESILAGLAWCDRVFGGQGVDKQAVLGLCRTRPEPVQIGGKASVGKGRTQLVFTEGRP